MFVDYALISTDSVSPRAIEDTLRMSYGHRIFDTDTIINMLSNDARGLGWAAVINETLVGISLSIVAPLSKIRVLFGDIIRDEIPMVLSNDTLIGVPLVLGVLFTCRKLGIGKSLACATIASLEKKLKETNSTGIMLSPVLIPPNGKQPIAKVLEELGFTSKKEIPNYWVEEPEPHYCDICFQQPCICSAKIYKKGVSK